MLYVRTLFPGTRFRRARSYLAALLHRGSARTYIHSAANGQPIKLPQRQLSVFNRCRFFSERAAGVAARQFRVKLVDLLSPREACVRVNSCAVHRGKSTDSVGNGGQTADICKSSLIEVIVKEERGHLIKP